MTVPAMTVPAMTVPAMTVPAITGPAITGKPEPGESHFLSMVGRIELTREPARQNASVGGDKNRADRERSR